MGDHFVSRKTLDDHTFPALVDAAKSAGVDVEGWSFGKHKGMMLDIVIFDDINPRQISTTVFTWKTIREAYQGMSAMIAAYAQVPR